MLPAPLKLGGGVLKPKLPTSERDILDFFAGCYMASGDSPETAYQNAEQAVVARRRHIEENHLDA